jgi:hypothetical protein
MILIDLGCDFSVACRTVRSSRRSGDDDGLGPILKECSYKNPYIGNHASDRGYREAGIHAVC